MPPAAVRPSARYRSVIVVSLLAFMLAGLFALARLPVDLPPAADALRLNVQVSAPGLTAPVIEEMLTRRLESALAGVPGVAAMESVTTTGGADVVLRLRHRRDVEPVQREVLARLDRARTWWPASVEVPTPVLSDDASRAAEFILTSRAHDALALRDWAEAGFARRLRELPGVAAVDVAGGAVREILVLPDQRRLAGYGLSFEDVLRTLRKNPEASSRAGRVPAKKRTRREPILSGSLAALAAVPVVLPDGESVLLSEVARLALRRGPDPAAFQVDGAEAVKVTLGKQPRAALSEVAAEARAHGDWMRANRLLPEDIEIHSFASHDDEARRPLRNTAQAFFAGFGMVLVAVQLFWGRARRTLLVGAVTVAALQGVFIAMALSGAALDAMTLGGLVLGTGLFGGGVMLMFEVAARRAPLHGVHPVVAAAVAMAAALAPVWFVGGELGALYREPVSVYAGAWLLAALLAWRLVPMFDARRRLRAGASWNAAARHAVAGMQRFYEALLRRLLRRAAPVLAAFALALVALAGAVFMKERAPVTLESPEGELVLRLQGPDDAVLTTLADEIVQRLRALPEWREASYSAQAAREEWLLRLDEERARELGVDIAMAGKALAIATTGIPAGSFRDAERRYEVRLRLPPEDAGAVAAGKILLLGELENRPAVHVRDIATLERASVPVAIHRRDGKAEVEISALPADGFPPERMAKKTGAALDELALPSGYRLSPGRGGETARNYRGPMALGLALFLVFAALSWLHRSWRLALSAILAAGAMLFVTGALLCLFGLSLSPPVWLGALLLLGIAAGQVSALPAPAEARPPGVSLSLRHLRQVARRRFRPMLVMVLTAVLGMLPLIWVNGGVPALSILVIVLITGLAVSLPMNLLLTPLVLWLIARKEQTPVSRRL